MMYSNVLFMNVFFHAAVTFFSSAAAVLNPARVVDEHIKYRLDLCLLRCQYAIRESFGRNGAHLAILCSLLEGFDGILSSQVSLLQIQDTFH